MSEKEENPPTLASLRARKSKPRTSKSGLLFTPQSEPLFDQKAGQPETSFAREPAPSPAVKDRPVRPSIPSTRVAAASALERRIWTVRSLVSNIRQQVEDSYTDLWVEGEISNCRSAPSGHIYFTLKDGEAQLPVVLFRRQSSLLRFRPTDGLAVLVRGSISVYETRGQLQLIAETMEPRGAGALQLAFNHPDMFRVVGAHSPSLHVDDGTFAGVYGTGQDFGQREPIDLAARAPGIEGLKIWIDTGEEDPWLERDEMLHAALLERGIAHNWSVLNGGHNGDYWTDNLPAYLRFYDSVLNGEANS